MDLRKIKKLIELVEESGISELEVRSGDEAVRIARPVGSSLPVASAAVAVPSPSASATNAASQAASVPVRAPMAGTFYAASAPGEPAFVSVGSHVHAGDVLCIIESMKMMNEIRAEQDGEIGRILVENGEPVGSGQALFHLR